MGRHDRPASRPEGLPTITDHTSIGITAGPLFGALGLLAAVIKARETGEGAYLEVAQSDAAAAFDWLRIETYRAYQRPQEEVTGNASDGYERRPPGTGGMAEAVRYQFYASSDGYVLFMASERKFWQNFCSAVGREDLFAAKPGEKLASHARGDLELRREARGDLRGQDHGAVGGDRAAARHHDQPGQHAGEHRG